MDKLYKNEEVLESYIGTPEKFYWYKYTFSKYDVNGVEKFAWAWSWWAFLGGAFYLLYRKCYVEALAIWVLGIVLSYMNPGAYFIFSVASGGVLPYLVYKKYRKVVAEVEQKEYVFEKQIEMIKYLGGANVTARNIFIGLYILALVVMFFVMTLMMSGVRY